MAWTPDLTALKAYLHNENRSIYDDEIIHNLFCLFGILYKKSVIHRTIGNIECKIIDIKKKGHSRGFCYKIAILAKLLKKYIHKLLMNMK